MAYDLDGTRKEALRESKFQIRKEGRPYAGWDNSVCTPGKATLQNMKNAGYRLYIDGKLQR